MLRRLCLDDAELAFAIDAESVPPKKWTQMAARRSLVSVLSALMAVIGCTTLAPKTEEMAEICFALRLLVSFAHADVNQPPVPI